MTIPDADLEDRFAALGPWYTQYKIGGAAYGGENCYDDDRRVALFQSWCTSRRRVLELGSFEGAHSLQIAADPAVEEVVCIEGREESTRRAAFVRDLFGSTKLQLLTRNLEVADLSDLGRFDVIFCAGTFYHLSRPWQFLQQLPALSPRLFLDTHYANDLDVEVDGFAGSYFEEAPATNPLSGLVDTSFWPSFPNLVLMLVRVGYVIRAMEVHPSWPNGPRAHLYCEHMTPLAT